MSIFWFSKQHPNYAVPSLFRCQKPENLFALFLGLRLSELTSEHCKFFTMGEQAHLSFPRLLNCQRRLLSCGAHVELIVGCLRQKG